MSNPFEAHEKAIAVPPSIAFSFL